MLKILLKKQMMETASYFTVDGKTGKKRSALVALLFFGLILYAVAGSGIMFFKLAKALCAPLVSAGLGWAYFAVTGMMAFSISCIMGALISKSKLYEAKDNELLLAMPVKPQSILLARVIGLYAFELLFSAVVLVPTAVQYFIVTGFSFSGFVGCVALLLLLPLGGLAVGALLGWFIAWIANKTQRKNLITYIVVILFLVGYFYAYSKLQGLIANGAAVGESLSGVFVLQWIGKMGEGSWWHILFSAGLFLGVFALVYALLVKTFLSVVTTKRGEKKTAYKEKKLKSGSVFFALLKKEMLRTVKSPVVLLNVAIGSFLSIVGCVLILVNTETAQALKGALGDEIYAIVCTVVCFIASSNTVTSSSVSLEGENIWVLQSAPIETKRIFFAKLAWHFSFTAIPATVCQIVACAVLGAPFGTALVSVLLVCAVSAFCALFGLASNLKFPNLQWTNETVAVKQGVSTVLAMFGSWAFCALLIGGYFLFGKYMPVGGYLAICVAFFAVLSVGLAVWLGRKGVQLWKAL